MRFYDAARSGDFRDWAAITQWAQDIARQLTPAPRCRHLFRDR